MDESRWIKTADDTVHTVSHSGDIIPKMIMKEQTKLTEEVTVGD
jgi:hypothetical protein